EDIMESEEEESEEEEDEEEAEQLEEMRHMYGFSCIKKWLLLSSSSGK
ncbi:hypothetical protein Tco_0636579, partial [Tanacetum coccineum]